MAVKWVRNVMVGKMPKITKAVLFSLSMFVVFHRPTSVINVEKLPPYKPTKSTPSCRPNKRTTKHCPRRCNVYANKSKPMNTYPAEKKTPVALTLIKEVSRNDQKRVREFLPASIRHSPESPCRCYHCWAVANVYTKHCNTLPLAICWVCCNVWGSVGFDSCDVEGWVETTLENSHGNFCLLANANYICKIN